MADPAPPADPSHPGVSVIIPAYNYAHYLPEAMDSVLQQDYPNFELIIVDDGSTDNTPAVVANYGNRARYIHQKNAGLPAARNTGIRHARFDHVMFLDADDRLLPGQLREAMSTLTKLPEAFAIVAFPAQYTDQHGNQLPTKQLAAAPGHEVTGRDILLKTRFGTTGLLARRAVFEECGYFDESLRSSEDRDMWIRIASRRKIFLHGENRVVIRRHAVSMSKNSDRMKTNTHRVISKAWSDRRVPHTDITFWLRVHSFRHFQAAWMYHDEGRPAAALRDLLISLLLWPWFPQPHQLNEPPLFRLRSLLRFLLRK